MTVLLIEGFDYYASATSVQTGVPSTWRQIPGAGWTPSLVAGRFGGQAYRGEYSSITRPLPVQPQLATLGAAFTLQERYSNGYCMGFLDSARAFQIGLDISASTGEISLERGTTVIATSPSGTIDLNTWYYIELEVYIHDTEGFARVYVNSSKVIDFTGDTQSTANEHVAWAAFGHGQNSFRYLVDDIYVSDTLRLGEMRVQTLYPDADVSIVGDWTLTSGSDAYMMVDEATTDGDTTYMQAEDPSDKAVFSLADFGERPYQVRAVEVVAHTRKTDAGTRSARVMVESNSVEAFGEEVYLTNTYGFVRAIFNDNPDTEDTWTAEEVDAMNAGVEVVV